MRRPCACDVLRNGNRVKGEGQTVGPERRPRCTLGNTITNIRSAHSHCVSVCCVPYLPGGPLGNGRGQYREAAATDLLALLPSALLSESRSEKLFPSFSSSVLFIEGNKQSRYSPSRLLLPIKLPTLFSTRRA